MEKIVEQMNDQERTQACVDEIKAVTDKYKCVLDIIVRPLEVNKDKKEEEKL